MKLLAKYDSTKGWILEELDLGDLPVITEMQDAADRIFVWDNSESKWSVITKDNFAKRYKTIVCNKADMLAAQNGNDAGYAAIYDFDFNSTPYDVIRAYEFVGSPVGTEHIAIKFNLPDSYDGGTVKVKLKYCAAGTVPTPGVSDTVKFGIQAKAYQDNQQKNQALGTMVYITDVIGNAYYRYVIDEVTLTIAGAAAGANEVHALIARDTTVLQGYGGSLYLEYIAIEYGVNKWSD